MSYTFTTLRNAVEEYTQNDEATFVSNIGLFVRMAEERILKSVELTVFQKNASGSMTSGNQFLAVPSDFISPLSLSITNSSSLEYLLFKDSDFVQTYTPNSATTGIPKYYGQFDVNNFILGPTPNAGFTTTLSYFYRPTSLTQELLTLTVGASGSFTVTETITGSTSGVTTTISALPTSTTMTIVVPSGTFTNGETITGSTSGATTTVTSTGADTGVTWLSENAELTLLYAALVEAYTFMKGENDMLTLYNNRFMESLSRLKNIGEAKEISDEYRTGQIMRQKS
jgi:hypothetical protein|tara:strand:+ start:444 stop:1295 length:852 start_codon:yes stop_codon:yes gene_type:complete